VQVNSHLSNERLKSGVFSCLLKT